MFTFAMLSAMQILTWLIIIQVLLLTFSGTASLILSAMSDPVVELNVVRQVCTRTAMSLLPAPLASEENLGSLAASTSSDSCATLCEHPSTANSPSEVSVTATSSPRPNCEAPTNSDGLCEQLTEGSTDEVKETLLRQRRNNAQQGMKSTPSTNNVTTASTPIARNESYDLAMFNSNTLNSDDLSEHSTVEDATDSHDNYERSVVLRDEISSCSSASNSRSPASTGISRKHKITLIKRVLKTLPLDLSLLRQLAICPGGLISDDLRRLAWPLLAGLRLGPDGIPIHSLSQHTTEQLEAHREYNQVDLDVRRTLARFPPNMQPPQRSALQKQLTSMIVRILVNHPVLQYYQGFHDICLTILLVVGEQVAYPICECLAATSFHDFLASSLDRCNQQLFLLYPIVRQVDPELEHFLWRSEVGTIFALSWLITWYGHVIGDHRKVVRLYDLFLASHELMPIYLGAAILLHRSCEILSTECEMPYVHALLSKIPVDLPIETLIEDATSLFTKYPPSKLLSLQIKPPEVSFKRFLVPGDDSAAGREMSANNGRTQLAKRRKSPGASIKYLLAVAATAFAIYAYKYLPNQTGNFLTSWNNNG